MDHQPHYYRGRDGLPHFSAMDALDLNLHLAPPPAAANSATPPPYPPPPPPLRHHHPGIFDFQPLPTPQPMWTRFFLDASPPSPSPPSPGEIDLGNGYYRYHPEHSPPFWGMDFSDMEAPELDLSPLLHDHFLREDDDELEAALLDEDDGGGHQFDHYRDSGLNWDQDQDWWGRRSTGSAATRLNSSGRATQATAAAAAAADVAEAPQSSVAAASKSPNIAAKRKNKASSLSLESNSSQLEQKGGDEKLRCQDGERRHPDRQEQEQEQQPPPPPPRSSGKDFFFDCNVCFDVANEPVVTSCGHLFCWPCLYQWLHVHSHNDECPVCKGAVSDADVIPIYGRGGGGGDARCGGAAAAAVAEGSCSSASIYVQRIPPRPRARRTDSIRHPVVATDVALSEMLRWRRFMRMWHQHTSRLMLERRASGGGGGGVRRSTAMVPSTVIDQLHHRWPYNVVDRM